MVGTQQMITVSQRMDARDRLARWQMFEYRHQRLSGVSHEEAITIASRVPPPNDSIYDADVIPADDRPGQPAAMKGNEKWLTANVRRRPVTAVLAALLTGGVLGPNVEPVVQLVAPLLKLFGL